jgi:hypothetical protein
MMRLIVSAVAVLALSVSAPARAAQAPPGMEGLWCPAQPESDGDNTHGPNWERYVKTTTGTEQKVKENCVTVLSNGLVESTEACVFTAVKQVHPGSYEMTLKCLGIDPKQDNSVGSYAGKRSFDLINGELTISYPR